MKPVPLLHIAEGEEIVHGLVTAYIPGTGCYKFLSKKKADGSYEWVHFVERITGVKESVYRGDTKTLEELNTVVEIVNKNLKRFFGKEMLPGKTEVSLLNGLKDDGTVH